MFLKFMVHTPPCRPSAACGISIETAICVRIFPAHGRLDSDQIAHRPCASPRSTLKASMLPWFRSGIEQRAAPRADEDGLAPRRPSARAVLRQRPDLISGARTLREPRQEGEHLRPARYLRTLSGYELRIRNSGLITGKLGKVLN